MRMGKPRSKLLIVDGYNVIRSGSRYKRIAFPDYTDDVLNVARECLANDVVSFIDANTEAIIVYDGTQRHGQRPGDQTVGGIRIMFSASGVTADSVIERLAHDAKERDIETLVISSDATIQDTVFGGGVNRMSAEGFCQEMEREEDSRSELKSLKPTRKSTIADRIPAETLAKLNELRDELGR